MIKINYYSDKGKKNIQKTTSYNQLYDCLLSFNK